MYELSFHTPAPGEVATCRAALQSAAEGLGAFLVGAWRGEGGGHPGVGITLCDWPDFATREAIRHRLSGLTDAEGPGAMTSEHWIVTPVSAVAAGPALSGAAIYDLRVQGVLNGHQADAVARFAETHAPEIEAQGGKMLGQFDVTLGPGRPVLVTLLSWPGHQDMHEGWQAIDAAPHVAAALDRDRMAFGQGLFRRADQYLLRGLSR